MKSLDLLKGKGVPFKVIELKEVPKSARDVERLYGCPLGQVLKSLVFIGEKPVMAVLPGDRKVDVGKLAQAVGLKELRIAKPQEVLEVTGYEVGGVTPFGFSGIKVMDESVFTMEKVNVGSGKAEVGIELSTESLKKTWDGKIAPITLTQA